MPYINYTCWYIILFIDDADDADDDDDDDDDTIKY